MIEVINGKLYQWDTGRYVQVTPKVGETVNEVHCYGENDSIAKNLLLTTQEGGVVRAQIPNDILQNNQKITICALMITEGCCRTTETRQEYVWSRARPDDYVYTETEVKSYAALRAELLKLVEQGGATDEQIAKAVEEYLKENPVESGSTAKIAYVTLLAEAWEGTGSPYSQIVNIDGATENSQVDLTPSVEQLAIFYDKDLAFVTENYKGVVTVYAIGQKPQNDYTIQVTVTEVSR